MRSDEGNGRDLYILLQQAHSDDASEGGSNATWGRREASGYRSSVWNKALDISRLKLRK
jgi:hypothetical protein